MALFSVIIPWNALLLEEYMNITDMLQKSECKGSLVWFTEPAF